MCGIVGIASLNPRQPVDQAQILPMLHRIAHRGPDDEGMFAAPGICFGHRRLSIIDISGGHQPLFGVDESTVIITNGEIYNYRELRRELTSCGHRFKTVSDAEIAAHAYDEWDLAFLDRLDGMFALALWDGRIRRLVLARDRMGEKPLYWALKDGVLVFASELSALLTHRSLNPTVDPVSLSQYLALEYVPAPRSICTGIQKLEPGTSLVMENGEVRTTQYWCIDPTPINRPIPYREAVLELRTRLAAAVRSRLVSDVPVGIFLSGGIDSSSIAALAAREKTIETFTIAFEEPSFDESRWARAVARRIGSKHREYVVRGEEMSAVVPHLGSLIDEPLGDASILPTLALSRFARGYVTVALGGDGGDELFAGYHMHQGHRLASVARTIPPVAQGLAKSVVRRLPVSHRSFSTGFKIRAFLRGSDQAPPYNHALWNSSFSPAEQRALLKPDVLAAAANGRSVFESIERAWSESKGAPLIARAAHLDARTYLPNDVLTKVDRASMSVALEVRAPFLARDVVEFAFSLPDSYKMRLIKGKRILRDAMRDLVPRSVLCRSKRGFGIPAGAWINGPLSEIVNDTLSPDRIRASGLLEPTEVARLLSEHRAKRADNRKPLWTLLVLELWCGEHVSRISTGS